MQVVYTLINPETRECYVWQTNSFSRRIIEHTQSWLIESLNIPTNIPLFVAISQWMIIINIIASYDEWDEKKQYEKMKAEGYKMLNKRI